MKKGLLIIGVMMVFVVQLIAQNNNVIVTSDEGGGAVNFKMTNMQTLTPIHLSTQVPSHSLFWIFGDGTYYSDPNEVGSSETESSPLSHSYITATGISSALFGGIFASPSYHATCYITDKYSEGDNPPSISTPVDITLNANNLIPSHYSHIIPTDKKIKLFMNHKNRKKDMTVYGISTKDIKVGDKVYLFYNSKLNNETDHFSYYRCHPSIYSDTTSTLVKFDATQTLTIQSFDSLNATSFANSYNNVLSYTFTTNDILITNILSLNIENRIFFVIKTNDTAEPNVPYNHLAVVTSATKSPITVNVLDAFIDFELQSKIGNQYIQDIDIISESLVEAHDPNYLKLLEICRYGNEKKYNLKFELTMCNDGEASARHAFIGFSDTKRQNIYQNIKFANNGFNGNIVNSNSSTDYPKHFKKIDLEFSRKLSKYKNGEDYDCGKLIFSVDTKNILESNLYNIKNAQMKVYVSFGTIENIVQDSASWKYPIDKYWVYDTISISKKLPPIIYKKEILNPNAVTINNCQEWTLFKSPFDSASSNWPWAGGVFGAGILIGGLLLYSYNETKRKQKDSKEQSDN